MALIGIDFDETIVDNLKKSDKYHPDLKEGARDAISKMRRDGHKILIFSCNSKSWIEKVLKHHDVKYDWLWEGEKPACSVYIDDRAVRFRDWTQAAKETRELIGEEED